MMPWCCVVEVTEGRYVPLMADGDSGVMSTWPTEAAAQDATRQHILVEAYGGIYLELMSR
jgi:hypothetical protein